MDRIYMIVGKLFDHLPASIKARLNDPIKYHAIQISRFAHNGFNDVPLKINLETNSACTRKCSYCPEKPKQTNHLPEQAVYKVIDELESLGYRGEIHFHGYNEPLTDKRIFGFLMYASNHIPKAKQRFHTNGDLLSEDKLKRLLDCGVNSVLISIHDPISGEQVLSLERLAGQYNKIVINDMRKDHRISLLWNRTGLVDIGQVQKSSRCYRVETLYINSNGDVLLCHNDAHGKVVFGNILGDKSVADIWNDEAFKKARANVRKGIFESDICSKCGHQSFES